MRWWWWWWLYRLIDGRSGFWRRSGGWCWVKWWSKYGELSRNFYYGYSLLWVTGSWSGGFRGKDICRMEFWGELGGRERGKEKRSSWCNSGAASLVYAVKGTPPHEVPRFDWVVWRVGIETWRMRSCVIRMPYLIEKMILLWLCKTTDTCPV